MSVENVFQIEPRDVKVRFLRLIKVQDSRVHENVFKVESKGVQVRILQVIKVQDSKIHENVLKIDYKGVQVRFLVKIIKEQSCSHDLEGRLGVYCLGEERIERREEGRKEEKKQ